MSDDGRTTMEPHPAGHPFDNECCADMVAAKRDIEQLKTDAADFRLFITEMREAMMYRLPLWATVIMSGLAGIVGWLLASK